MDLSAEYLAQRLHLLPYVKVGGDALPCGRAMLISPRMILQGTHKCRCQRAGIVRWNKQAGLAINYLLHITDLQADDRTCERHCL